MAGGTTLALDLFRHGHIPLSSMIVKMDVIPDRMLHATYPCEILHMTEIDRENCTESLEK